MSITHVLAHRGLNRLAETSTPLHHGGDPHSALWWIAFLSVVVAGLVAAMAVCLVFAVRAANTTAASAAARAERRTPGRRRATD